SRDWSSDVCSSDLEDRAEATGAGALILRFAGDGTERLVRELEVDAVELEQALVLLHQRVLGLGEDLDQGIFVELLQRRHDRKATDELGDEPELHQVFVLDALEQLPLAQLLLGLDVGTEAHALGADAVLNDVFDPGEGTAADEEDVRGVDLQEV